MSSIFKINNGFLGYRNSSETEYFSGSDTEELFNENLKNKPVDWIYRTKQISYVRNKNGHRCNELEMLKDEYILYTGCSHTEGIGIALEDSYAYISSKNLGTDYYNLGLGGSGIDAMIYNLSVWFAVTPKKPLALVVQWPEETRMLGIEVHDSVRFCPIRLAHETDDRYKQFLKSSWEIDFFECRKKLAQEFLNNLRSQTHVLEIADIHKFSIDNGRDLHSGINSNSMTAKFIEGHLKDKI